MRWFTPLSRAISGRGVSGRPEGTVGYFGKRRFCLNPGRIGTVIGFGVWLRLRPCVWTGFAGDQVGPESDILARMARQWPQEDVMAQCDARIDNDGSEPLVPQVLQRVSELGG